MAGISWGGKSGRNSRKHKKGSRASSTAGKDKGGSCIASASDRFMAGYARSYKYPGYADWCEKKKGI